jgi:hypothetical protein
MAFLTCAPAPAFRVMEMAHKDVCQKTADAKKKIRLGSKKNWGFQAPWDSLG